jgi:hypothetical protein
MPSSDWFIFEVWIMSIYKKKILYLCE